MLEGQNIVVMDLETERGAEDCRHCGQAYESHYAEGACAPWEGERPSDAISQFAPYGWNDKAALGLSIGCYYDYADRRLHWFDRATLEATMREFVLRASLLVSFNGIAHDFPLMRGLLRRQTDTGAECLAWCASIDALCGAFTALCARSYDILAAIWEADPDRKFAKGLNSLGAISVANDLGTKEMDGATAPRLWAQGRYAEVLNYVVGDVLKTKGLFEIILKNNGVLMRGDGTEIVIATPSIT